MMQKQKGFSLIELLIVVAIILIIAAIAIPNLLRSRIAANEASAVGSMRTINTAETTYASTYPGSGFATLFNLGLGGATAGQAASNGAQLLDNVLGCTAGTTGGICPKSGYNFSVIATGTPITTYQSNGGPITWQQTGVRNFYSDPSGVITARADQTSATSADPAIQ